MQYSIDNIHSDKAHDMSHNRQFQHPHLVQLFGVCSEKPIYIITEFMSQGGLFLSINVICTLFQFNVGEHYIFVYSKQFYSLSWPFILL